MKEATGELNMTVITVVAIAAVAAFFYLVIWPLIKSNLEQTSKCSAAVCSSSCGAGEVCDDCQYYDSDEGGYKTISCKISDDGSTQS